MIKYIKKPLIYSLLTTFLGMGFALPQAEAKGMPWMPVPGVRISLSPPYTPAYLKGLVIHPDNAFKFDFLVYKGDKSLDETEKKDEYQQLIKYFMASLTIPDEEQWVNLSPYEKNRIIEKSFSETQMGRDLLAQDYLLKQITSSLMYPEEKIGKEFWDRVYTRARQELGVTDIPMNTFNKVWITPDYASIYEKDNTVYVVENHLKVMLEGDYLALQKNTPSVNASSTANLASQVVKDIIIPELEREVNEGKNFAALRQIYSAMILATWYKRALKESLLGKIYANKGKVKGLEYGDKSTEQIYSQYLVAFKKGVFNYIKEDVDKYTQQPMPRKYFSGGAVNGYGRSQIKKADLAMAASDFGVKSMAMERIEAEIEAASYKPDELPGDTYDQDRNVRLKEKIESYILFIDALIRWATDKENAGVIIDDLNNIDLRRLEYKVDNLMASLKSANIKQAAQINDDLKKLFIEPERIFNRIIKKLQVYLDFTEVSSAGFHLVIARGVPGDSDRKLILIDLARLKDGQPQTLIVEGVLKAADKGLYDDFFRISRDDESNGSDPEIKRSFDAILAKLTERQDYAMTTLQQRRKEWNLVTLKFTPEALDEIAKGLHKYYSQHPEEGEPVVIMRAIALNEPYVLMSSDELTLENVKEFLKNFNSFDPDNVFDKKDFHRIKRTMEINIMRQIFWLAYKTIEKEGLDYDIILETQLMEFYLNDMETVERILKGLGYDNFLGDEANEKFIADLRAYSQNINSDGAARFWMKILSTNLLQDIFSVLSKLTLPLNSGDTVVNLAKVNNIVLQGQGQMDQYEWFLLGQLHAWLLVQQSDGDVELTAADLEEIFPGLNISRETISKLLEKYSNPEKAMTSTQLNSFIRWARGQVVFGDIKKETPHSFYTEDGSHIVMTYSLPDHNRESEFFNLKIKATHPLHTDRVKLEESKIVLRSPKTEQIVAEVTLDQNEYVFNNIPKGYYLMDIVDKDNNPVAIKGQHPTPLVTKATMSEVNAKEEELRGRSDDDLISELGIILKRGRVVADEFAVIVPDKKNKLLLALEERGYIDREDGRLSEKFYRLGRSSEKFDILPEFQNKKEEIFKQLRSIADGDIYDHLTMPDFKSAGILFNNAKHAGTDKYGHIVLHESSREAIVRIILNYLFRLHGNLSAREHKRISQELTALDEKDLISPSLLADKEIFAKIMSKVRANSSMNLSELTEAYHLLSIAKRRETLTSEIQSLQDIFEEQQENAKESSDEDTDKSYSKEATELFEALENIEPYIDRDANGALTDGEKLKEIVTMTVDHINTFKQSGQYVQEIVDHIRGRGKEALEAKSHYVIGTVIFRVLMELMGAKASIIAPFMTDALLQHDGLTIEWKDNKSKLMDKISYGPAGYKDLFKEMLVPGKAIELLGEPLWLKYKTVIEKYGADAAMTPGGIDFDSRNLDLRIKRDGNGVPLPVSQQNMDELMKIDYFEAVIVSIKPITNLPILSELR